MERFIQEVRSASSTQSVFEYRAKVVISVHGPGIPAALKDVRALRSQCVRAIRDAGLTDQQMREGGIAIETHWTDRQVDGHDARVSLLLCCEDAQRLLAALGAIDSMFDDERFTLMVAMANPTYQAEASVRAETQRAAVADAQLMAANLAAAAGLRLTGVLELEQFEGKVSGLRSFGEYDLSTAVAGSVFGGMVDEPLGPDTRITTLQYRVRFSAEPENLSSA